MGVVCSLFCLFLGCLVFKMREEVVSKFRGILEFVVEVFFFFRRGKFCVEDIWSVLSFCFCFLIFSRLDE